jgi:ATP-dependent DNA helicase 2 subunit 2
MASKDAVVFLVDCSTSMGPYMGAARDAVKRLTHQKMLQGKLNEVGILLYGVPDARTENRLAQQDEEGEQYRGIRELSMMTRPTVETLNMIGSMEATPESDDGSGPVLGDPLDAMVVGMGMMANRTKGKAFGRHMFLITDAASPIEGADELPRIAQLFRDEKTPTSLHVILVGHGALCLSSGSSALASQLSEEDAEVVSENVLMFRSVAKHLRGAFLHAAEVAEVLKVMLKKTKPRSSKLAITVGTRLRIKCSYFKRISKASLTSLKKECVRRDGAGNQSVGPVKSRAEYINPDTPDGEVKFDYLVRGHRYGREIIPITTADKNSMNLNHEGGPEVQLLGFVPRKKLGKNHMFLGETLEVSAVCLGRGASCFDSCVAPLCPPPCHFIPSGPQFTPDPDFAQSAVGFSALATAMKNRSVAAIVRFRTVVRDSSAPKPKLGCLLPSPSERSASLFYQQLPFSEDIREYTFPSFADPLPSRAPTAQHMEATRALVEAMRLPPLPADAPCCVGLHPCVQIIDNAVVARALHPDCALPEPPAHVLESISPTLGRLVENAEVLKTYQQSLSLKKQEGKAAARHKRTFWSDVVLDEKEGGDEDAIKRAKRVMEEAVSCTPSPSRVGSITPVPDFMAMVEAAEDAKDVEGLNAAVEQMQIVAKEILSQSLAPAPLLQKGSGCLSALRSVAIRSSDAGNFNSFMEGLKCSLPPLGWSAVVEAGCTLICMEEDSSADISREDALAFLSTAPQASSVDAARAPDESTSIAQAHREQQAVAESIDLDDLE